MIEFLTRIPKDPLTSLISAKNNTSLIFFSSSRQMKISLKALLIISTLWHDMVQGTIITCYCLQAQLLISNLSFLRGKLLHHTLTPMDWMRVRNIELSSVVPLEWIDQRIFHVTGDL